MFEYWRPIPLSPSYEASSLGRIRRIGKESAMKVELNSQGYLRLTLCESGNIKRHSVHSLVCSAFHGPRPDGYVIDHIDRNKLNNCPENLRYATIAQNTACGKFSKEGRTSLYRGVNWRADRERWAANGSRNSKTIFLGYFDDEVDAARAYDKFAKAEYGQFAELNFPIVDKFKIGP